MDLASYDVIEECNKSIEKMEKNLKKAQGQIPFLRYILNENLDRDNFNEEAVKIFKLIDSSRKENAKLVSILGTTSLNELVKETAVKLYFVERKEHLRIIFPELLPPRIRYGEGEHALSIQDIRNMYQPSFEEYARKPDKIRFNERVAIIYTFFYESEKKIKDYDNYETKLITDFIACNVLGEDSPRQCTIMYEYKIGDKDHTQIDIVPYRKLSEYMK